MDPGSTSTRNLHECLNVRMGRLTKLLFVPLSSELRFTDPRVSQTLDSLFETRKQREQREAEEARREQAKKERVDTADDVKREVLRCRSGVLASIRFPRHF